MSPSIAPAHPIDQDVYLVLDDFGQPIGRCWREIDEDRSDRETLISDLLDGHYSDPVKVVAFNTAEGWSRDVSVEIAGLIADECRRDGFDIPRSLEAFINRHRGQQEPRSSPPRKA
jgi:hypothetical protein